MKKITAIRITIFLVIIALLFVMINHYKQIEDDRYNESQEMASTCSFNMMWLWDELGVYESDSIGEKDVDYSNAYWWVDALKKCGYNTLEYRVFFYCPLDNERKYPSSYKINPNLRLSDFKREDLSNESYRDLYLSRSLKDRILVFYENKDYHRKNYKVCCFWNGYTDYLTDQEIVECIKTTRERIKRAKAKWKNL